MRDVPGVSKLLPGGPIAAEGRLECIVHHRVAPLFHARRALVLRTFRLRVCRIWLGLPLLRRRYVGRLRGRLDRCGYELGRERRCSQIDEIHDRTGWWLIGGQTRIGEAPRLHQLVEAERERPRDTVTAQYTAV
jgi:hypothetical protein